jgi:hypothetical protein
MGLRGRPRKTNEEKKMIGTYRKDRDVKIEVKGNLTDKIPDVEFDDEYSQQFFNDVCGIFIENGWMLDDFINDIIRASDWFGIYMEARGKPLTMKTHSGYEAVTPAYIMLKDSHKNLVDFENRYGLNLLSSQRFQKKDKKEEDPIDKLLNLKQ